MALNPNQYTATATTARQEEIDAGLRSYMLRVYNYMALGVALTGGICLAVASNQALFNFAAGAQLFLFLGVLGMGFFAHKIVTVQSVAAGHAIYWAYCALWGLLIAPLVALYLAQDPGLVARAFFITTGMFAGMSLFGYTTQKNLTGFGQFLMMAAIGLILVALVHILGVWMGWFEGSTAFSLIFSGAAVLIFAGMTAYETQIIKNMYSEHYGQDQLSKFALFGALMLYGSFVTMFIHILNILAILKGE
jgi:FtsH-binding integral membrane protein